MHFVDANATGLLLNGMGPVSGAMAGTGVMTGSMTVFGAKKVFASLQLERCRRPYGYLQSSPIQAGL